MSYPPAWIAAEIFGCKSGQLRKSALALTPLACPHSCTCFLNRSWAAGMKYVACRVVSEVPLSTVGAAPAQRSKPGAVPSAPAPNAAAPAVFNNVRRDRRGAPAATFDDLSPFRRAVRVPVID